MRSENENKSLSFLFLLSHRNIVNQYGHTNQPSIENQFIYMNQKKCIPNKVYKSINF